jgi:hypothetical protein
MVPSPAGDGAQTPYLSPTEDGAVLSWLEPSGEAWSLKTARLTGDSWGPAHTVLTADDLFVNWADFPSVVALADGRLAAHWLARGDAGGYDYGVRVALSQDDGATWSDPWTPHDDGSPTEHGFVSLVPLDDGGLGVLWLDGRRYAAGPEGEATEEMTLRARALGPDGEPGPETLVDARVCDCCQTSMARTGDGWVAVYRDRSDDEIRDIFVSRWTAEGWSEPRAVHRDGWTIAACPVNGPAVAARGERVAAAWYTEGGGVPRVQVAFSDDGGEAFAEPVRIDEGAPVGRVDVALDDDGEATVTWIERTGETAEIRLRRVSPGRAPADPVVVSTTMGARAAGFPRTTRLPGGDLLVAWTDVSGETSTVRLARLNGGGR